MYWNIENLINIITRFSVPSFMMISGALILHNDKNANRWYFYRKSVCKIYVPMFFSVFIMVVVRMGVNHYNGDYIFSGLKSVFNGTFYNLWYLYTLFFIYLAVPYIIQLKKSLDLNQYIILAVAWIIWAVISQATTDSKISFNINVCGSYCAYFVSGDVIRIIFEKKPIKSFYLKISLIIISFICIIVTFCLRKYVCSYYTVRAYPAFLSPTITIYSICIYTFFTISEIKFDYSWLAQKTYPMYLFHSIIIAGIVRFTNLTSVCRSDILGIFFLTVITFFLSLIIAVLFEKLMKYINKIKKCIQIGKSF